jgi:hypothetical protein
LHLTDATECGNSMRYLNVMANIEAASFLNISTDNKKPRGSGVFYQTT